MELDLSGKTALVTGASAGIGAAIASALAREGVRLALTARRAEAMRAVADSWGGGMAPVILPADITSPDEIDRLARDAQAALGQIDILVNAAGASAPTTLESDSAFWEEAYFLNFGAIRQLTHRLIPGMQARGWGRVICISGGMEQRLLNAAAPAKAALHVWAKSLSSVVAKSGITINTIVPGRIWSEQIRNKLHADPVERQAFIDSNIPIGRFGEPEELACLAAFLASPVASYITGTVIPVDGGMRRYPH